MTQLADSPLWGPRLRALLQAQLRGGKATLRHCQCGSPWLRREPGVLVCKGGHRLLLVTR